MRSIEEMSMKYVIGVDRGFATFGYAVFCLMEDRERVVDVGVFETKKSAKKANVLASSDNHRRNKELYMSLKQLVLSYNIVAAAAESTSLPRNARTAYLIGRADSVWSNLVTDREIPLVEKSPQSVKKMLCGKSSATKAEVQHELEVRYPGQFDAFKEAFPKGKWEHGFDAAAVLVTCLPGEIMKMARQLVRK